MGRCYQDKRSKRLQLLPVEQTGKRGHPGKITDMIIGKTSYKGYTQSQSSNDGCLLQDPSERKKLCTSIRRLPYETATLIYCLFLIMGGGVFGVRP